MSKQRKLGKNRKYSLVNKLRKEGRSHEEFELCLNQLSLEELIGLKLELSSKGLTDGKFYGFPILYSLFDIVRDAVLKYAVSATKSKREASRFLGISEGYLIQLVRKYKIEEYFSDEQ